MKPINLSSYIEIIRESILKQLDTLLKDPTCDTKLDLKINIADYFKKDSKDVCAIVNFSSTAWLKMITMVLQENRELAMHGIVERLGPSEFYVKDMLMYPQTASSATVESDDSYGVWLSELPDDTFNNLRFQMHSHVNMGVSPSCVDTNFYTSLLTDIQDFYIFMILNKRQEVFITIYDIAQNLIYEKADIDIYVLDENGLDVLSWVTSQAKEKIKTRTFTSTPAVEFNSKLSYPTGYNQAKELLAATEVKPIKNPRGRPPKNNKDKSIIDPRMALIEEDYPSQYDYYGRGRKGLYDYND